MADSLRPERASDRAYAALVDDIQAGRLGPGTVLGEADQAARLGISRTPVREAIGRLTAEGLLVQQSPRVTVVSGIGEAPIRALFELRQALETAAAAAAARRGDRALFAGLAEEFAAARAELGTSAGRDHYYSIIARFDAAITTAVANDYLTAALRPVRTHLVRVRRLAHDHPERLAASATEHRLIAQAIADGDPALAAHATHVHLHNALTSIVATLPEGSR